jgi:hypothetical protein
MAEVIFEGGKNPMIVKTWQDAVKLIILESLYNHGLNLPDIMFRLYSEPQYSWFMRQHERSLTQQEAKAVIVEMFRDGLIEGGQYKCECCKSAQIAPEKVFDHIIGFKITGKGRDLIPEHIFP